MKAMGVPPRIDQVGHCNDFIELAGGLAELAALGGIERVVLLAVLVRALAHLRGVDPDLEGGRGGGGRKREFGAAEGGVIGVGLDPVAAHEGEQRIFCSGELRKLRVAVESGVEDLIGHRGGVLPELLEVRIAGLGELLHGAGGLRALGALHHLAEGGQQQADEQADDADHHQQFDQGEAGPGGATEGGGAAGRAAGSRTDGGGCSHVWCLSQKYTEVVGGLMLPGPRVLHAGEMPPVWRSPS